MPSDAGADGRISKAHRNPTATNLHRGTSTPNGGTLVHPKNPCVHGQMGKSMCTGGGLGWSKDLAKGPTSRCSLVSAHRIAMSYDQNSHLHFHHGQLRNLVSTSVLLSGRGAVEGTQDARRKYLRDRTSLRSSNGRGFLRSKCPGLLPLLGNLVLAWTLFANADTAPS